MNIQQEIRTPDTTMEKKKDYLSCLSIFLTPELPVDTAPFHKSMRLVCRFFVDHPIILDRVDKTRNRRTARGERPLLSPSYRILTWKERFKNSADWILRYFGVRENSKKSNITVISMFCDNGESNEVMKKARSIFRMKIEIFQITLLDHRAYKRPHFAKVSVLWHIFIT